MFCLRSAYAASTSLSATVTLSVFALASSRSCVMRSSSRLSLAVATSSSEGFAVGSTARRYALSTSAFLISRPSTTAQTSADAGGGGGADLEPPQPTASAAKARTARRAMSVLGLFIVHRSGEQRHRRSGAKLDQPGL